MESKPVVSIIVPVYNAEETVHIALKSLLMQDYPCIEAILINDCSKDDTLVVIRSHIPAFDDRGISLKIISHDRNEGVSVARNTGLDHATGEFIYYVDADDFIEPDTIKIMVEASLNYSLDIVGCNWFLSFRKNERKMHQRPFSTSLEAIQMMLNGTLRWNLWLFMVRRSLYETHRIRFIPGMNMGEDLIVMIKLFVHANRVAFLDRALYHYGQSNELSLTKTYSDSHIEEVTNNVMEVEKYLLNSVFRDRLGDGIAYLKLNIKLPLLISDEEERYQRWLTWFPEVNTMVMNNKALSFRIKVIQWCAARGQFWVIKLYYRVIIRLVYGKIYK